MLLCQEQLEVGIIHPKKLQHVENWVQKIKQSKAELADMIIQGCVGHHRGVTEWRILRNVIRNDSWGPINVSWS